PEVEEAEERLENQENPLGGGANEGGEQAPTAFPTPRPAPHPVAPTARPTALPHPTQQPAPRYPRDAYRRGEQGTVLLRVHVNPRGEPGDIDLIDSSGSRSLDRAAIDAVRRWRFAPAMQGETPVEGTVQVPIEFALGRFPRAQARSKDRKSTRLNSSHVKISYAVFCLKKKNS